jgi:hypothetical protein
VDPSTRGPFIRGVVVALILAVGIIIIPLSKRRGVSFDYDVESQTTLPDGEEIQAEWSGKATEAKGARVYDTSHEDAPTLAIFDGHVVKHSTRHSDVSARHEDAERIEGYHTRRYRITDTDTIWFEGFQRPAVARTVTDYWVAPGLRNVAEPLLTFADSVMRSRVGINEPRVSGRHSAREHKLPGTPLRIVSQAVFVDPDGKRYESETTSEISDVERAPRFAFSHDF